MSEQLPFIKELCAAYNRRDRRAALTAAFAAISEADDGRFGAFMKEVRLCRLPDLCLHREGSETVDRASPSEWAAGWCLRDVRPGHYRLFTSTGRVLWRERLTEADLIWSHAVRRVDTDLRVAADTDSASPSYGRQFEVLEGEIRATVYPGVTSGTIVINDVP